MRVLVVDDSLIVREGLIALLNTQADMEVVGEAANGQDGIAAYRLLCPDVVLMDVEMPLMNGITATRALLIEFPFAAVVLFSALPSEEVLFLMKSSGARGIVDKAAPKQELFAALRAG
jgi:hemolysin D